MRDRIVVTGATGFIGSKLVRRLVRGNAIVRVFVRTPERLPRDLRGRVEVVAGDITDRSATLGAVRGADEVFHLAACARAWARDPAEFTEVNVEGVKNVLEAARSTDVHRLVHVSTVLTLRHRDPTASPSTITRYERSKVAGERLVEGYAEEGRHAVVVHPTRVYGPGPLNDANGVTKMISLYLRGRFRARIADGGARANYVHADDVAEGIRLAAAHGRSGRHYVLGGSENITLERLLEKVAELAGVRRQVVPLPPALARGVGAAGELLGRLGVPTSVTRAWVEVFMRDLPVDITPARRELGYSPRPLDAGLAEVVRWLDGERARPSAGERYAEELCAVEEPPRLRETG